MRKTYTNSRCRRTFNTALDAYAGRCPYCGKAYPRLPKAERFSLHGKPESLYRVFLWSYGQEKIKTIKVIRQYRPLGLAEVKELVESAPVSVGLSLSRETALRFAGELNALGCVADVRKAAKAAKNRDRFRQRPDLSAGNEPVVDRQN